MSFTNETTHYGLPQWIGSDKPTYLVDQNNAYQKIDAEIYNANTTAGAAQTAAEGAVQTAGAASTTASDALTTAQTASSTADNALLEAQTANTNAQAAQTAAGAAQTAAQAAQEAAAGNSITNLAPAYDPTITYAVDDLVTAEGKLYKCIVAVVTPEQFDINKWDDVTTSEVYARLGSGGDVYTKAESDAKFETQTHAAATYETKANVTAKNNLKLSTDSTKQIRFGIDGNGNYGYIKNGENTVNPFRSAAGTHYYMIGIDTSTDIHCYDLLNNEEIGSSGSTSGATFSGNLNAFTFTDGQGNSIEQTNYNARTKTGTIHGFNAKKVDTNIRYEALTNDSTFNSLTLYMMIFYFD